VTLPRQPKDAAPAGAVFFSAPGEAWSRQLWGRIGHLWVLKMLSTMGAIAAFFYAYFWVMRHPLAEVTVMPLIWMDRVIAFEPLSFPLYVLLWVYVSLGTALAREFRELAAFGLASLAISLVGFAVFMLMPTRVPEFDIDWSLHPTIEFLKRTDVGGNAFPSLHAAFSVFTACVLHAQFKAIGAPRWLRIGNLLLCAGILYSTMATRQHVALDAFAGALLGGAGWLAYLGALRRSRADE
jgi:hypothetical protein